MNKTHILTFLTLLFLATPVVAQESAFIQDTPQTEIESAFQEEVIFKRDTTKSEAHINVYNLLVFTALDVGYERIINDHSSAGVEFFSKVSTRTKAKI